MAGNTPVRDTENSARSIKVFSFCFLKNLKRKQPDNDYRAYGWREASLLSVTQPGRKM